LCAEHRMNRCHALIIGNADYADSASFAPLKYAVADAESVFTALTHSDAAIFSPDTSRCRFNLDSDGMTRTLKEFFQPIDSADLVLIYFSGHGTRLGTNRLFWAMTDTRGGDLAGTAFNVETLIPYFVEKRLHRTIVVMDCCFAAKALKAPGIQAWEPVSGIEPEGMADKGRIFVAAAHEAESAYEVPKLQHGLFTYHFLRGLEQGEAVEPTRRDIGIFDLCQYVRKQIRERQRLVVSGQDIDGSLIIGKNPKFQATQPPECDLSGLPETSALLVGRDDELAMLDEAWRDAAAKIMVIVAMGGTGKTALVNRWLALM